MKTNVLLLALLVGLPTAQASDRPPLTAPKVEIAYASPAAALAALRAKPGVSIREENDWFVINDSSENAFWSITRPTHPAHPTAIKRTLVQEALETHLAMRVQCGAPKEACDKVVQQFKQINENLSRSQRP